MTLPVHLYDDYVERSIYKFLYDRWAAAAGFPVYFNDDAEADPDAQHSGTLAMRWAVFRIVQNNTGEGRATLAQLDFFARVGTRGQQLTTGARFNSDVSAMVRAFRATLAPFNRSFSVYEFSTPATPTETRGRLFFEGPDGELGKVGGARPMPTINGVRHQALTLRIRHILDTDGLALIAY